MGPSPLPWPMKVTHGGGSVKRSFKLVKQMTRDQERGHGERIDKYFVFSLTWRAQPLSTVCRLCRMMPGWPCSTVPSQGVTRGCSPAWVPVSGHAPWHKAAPAANSNSYEGSSYPLWGDIWLFGKVLIRQSVSFLIWHNIYFFLFQMCRCMDHVEDFATCPLVSGTD